MVPRIAVITVVVAVLAGCTPQPHPQIEAIRAYMRETTGDDLKAGGGGLRVTGRDVVGDGPFATVRGQIENRYDEPVSGIRYVVTVYEPGDPPRVVDRWQRQFDATLDAGERRSMRLEVESMYFSGSGRTPFTVDAYPVKLGGKEMPPPEGWR